LVLQGGNKHEKQFQQPNGFFTISRPSNWRAFASSGFAVSLAPTGGVVEVSDGQPVLVYGMIINHYAPFTGASERRARSLQRNYAPFEDRRAPRRSLEDATDDLVYQILSTNFVSQHRARLRPCAGD
jgi:hypothetical protein